MMSSWAIWSGLALLFFWAVGAYRRLVRLRARVGAAFAALDAQLVQQLVWAQGCLPLPLRGATMGPVPQDADPVMAAWRSLQAASEQLAESLAATRRRILCPSAVEALTAARCGLNTAWLRVCALDREIGGAALPAALHEQHEQLLAQVLPQCEIFNQAVRAYNDAIGQFPALLLARLCRFRRAGVLLPMALVA